MSTKRRAYTAEFKREAVQLVTERGYSLGEAARSLGVHPNLLRTWKQKLERERGSGSVARDLSLVEENRRQGVKEQIMIDGQWMNAGMRSVPRISSRRGGVVRRPPRGSGSGRFA
ncbi:MAG: transposase [Candidatus Hydrogenedentes bacterium]|nr:transposase [Candidatus Hydrogenedentota bacterium]